MKIHDVRGDLTDISAKKEALVVITSQGAMYGHVKWYVRTMQ